MSGNQHEDESSKQSARQRRRRQSIWEAAMKRCDEMFRPMNPKTNTDLRRIILWAAGNCRD